MNTKNIEFYSGPNGGKTTAATLFSSLLGVNEKVVEIPPKIPQDFFINEINDSFNDPFKMYFRQLEVIKQLDKQTDYTVLDNPLLSELVYLKDKKISEKEKNLLSELIITQRNQFNNIPIFIHKKNSIVKKNSIFDENESLIKEKELFNILKNNNVNFINEYYSHPLIGIEILKDFDNKGIIEITNKNLKNFLNDVEPILIKLRNKKSLKETIYNFNEHTTINLYAGPGSGKSTTSRTLSALFGGNGISSIAPIEIPKLHVWEKSFTHLSDQLKIFANQKFNQDLCNKKFKISVVDSPLLMQLIYMEQNKSDNIKELEQLIVKAFEERKKQNVFSYFLKRKHSYSNYGRVHSEEQSNQLNNKIIEILTKYNVDFKCFDTHPFIGFEIFNELVFKNKLITINEPLLLDFLEITKNYIKIEKENIEMKKNENYKHIDNFINNLENDLKKKSNNIQINKEI